jgi:hypothetical protein
VSLRITDLSTRARSQMTESDLARGVAEFVMRKPHFTTLLCFAGYSDGGVSLEAREKRDALQPFWCVACARCVCMTLNVARVARRWRRRPQDQYTKATRVWMTLEYITIKILQRLSHTGPLLSACVFDHHVF